MMKAYSFPDLVRAKLKAALIHAVVTLLVSVITACLVFFVWYPSVLAQLTGGLNLYLLVLGVEVCLGPLMSLVIYNPCKPRKELIRDYLIVGSIQIAALLYGLYSTFVARPAYVVFVVDQLEIVRGLDLEEEDVSEASDEFQRLPVWGPAQICVERPKTTEEKNFVLFSGLSGKDIHLMPKYYRECKKGERYEGGKDIGSLINRLKQEEIKYARDLERLTKGDYVWMPIKGRFGMQVALLSKAGEYSYIDIDPFFVESEK